MKGLSVSLAGVVSLLSSFLPYVQAASRADYIRYSQNASDVLNQQFYDPSTGRWQNLWWQSANMITSLGDFAGLDPNRLLPIYRQTFRNTFTAAPKSADGDFINNFYDDEGWWALGWIQVYDLTREPMYLDTAKFLFEDMRKGSNATCGGQWWSKAHDMNVAIANELFLFVAAALGNRVPERKPYYQEIATNQLDWFLGSGLINENNTINDGLNLDSCEPRGAVFTYNQGVILGALVELNKLSPNPQYLEIAATIAQGAMNELTDSNGILIEKACPIDPNPTCEQFKGVFARNLKYLQAAAPNEAYVTFLQTNADSIWRNDRQSDGQLGPQWEGPYYEASAPSQGAALDCLVGAAAVSA